jgi:hypothetical protein
MFYYHHHHPIQSHYNNVSHQIYPTYAYIPNTTTHNLNVDPSAFVNINGHNQNEYLSYWSGDLNNSYQLSPTNVGHFRYGTMLPSTYSNKHLKHSTSNRSSTKDVHGLYTTNYDMTGSSANVPYVNTNPMSESQASFYPTANRTNNVHNGFNSPKTFQTYFELNNFNSTNKKQTKEIGHKPLLINTHYNDYLNKLKKSQSNNVSRAVIENTINQDRLNNNSDDSDDFDNNRIDIYRLLTQKNLDHEQLRRIERNQNCLTLLIEGDLIEYVEKESDIEERDGKRHWAIYMGNTMIMRFDTKSNTIVYESYWKIAKTYYIFINRDLDRRFFTLPIYEILNKARDAYANRKFFHKIFSSDRNFVLWCRFDVNKSDIESATLSQSNELESLIELNEEKENNLDTSKSYVLLKFLNSLDQGEDVFMEIEI